MIILWKPKQVDCVHLDVNVGANWFSLQIVQAREKMPKSKFNRNTVVQDSQKKQKKTRQNSHASANAYSTSAFMLVTTVESVTLSGYAITYLSGVISQ